MYIGQYFKNINSKFKNHFFSGVSLNSKVCKKNYIFFAIKGVDQDGNKFVDEAILKGAKTIISEEKFQGFKILYRKQKNFGPNFSRNRAEELIPKSCKYAIHIDSDDTFYNHETLELMVKDIEKSKRDIGIVSQTKSML